MVRKVTRMRRRIKEATKKLQHLESTWQDDPKYQVIKTCHGCNTNLEDKDYLMVTEGDPLSDALCRFCGILV